MGQTFAIQTLGCKLNFSESTNIANELQEAGMQRVSSGQKADLYIVNTCSVTELADKKSRYAIRKIHRFNPHAMIVATGCYTSLKPEEVKQVEGVDLIVSNERKDNLVNVLTNIRQDFMTGENGHMVQDGNNGRTRGFLKVQDGCNYFCTYCTIPKARGRSRNQPVEEVVLKAQKMVQHGVKEIILTGINMGDFGRSTGETFLELVQALDSVDGVERYRISSIEPNLLTEEIMDFVAQSDKFTPHFHIPLQAGSDTVLTLMKRKYDTALFVRRVHAIRERFPHAFIAVDVIAGTNGETRELYKEGYHFIEELAISDLHVFTYSERPGTRALEIEGAVSVIDKQKRSANLQLLGKKKWLEFARTQQGRSVKVLFERPKDEGFAEGLSENYLRVVVPCNEDIRNQLRSVKLTGIDEDHLCMKGVFC